MSRNKDKELKDFLIATRKKIGPSITNAPFWVIQKAGRRIWNRRQKRHWRDTDLGKKFKKIKRKQKDNRVKGRKHFKKSREKRKLKSYWKKRKK